MCGPVLCGHGVVSSGCILLAVMAYDCYAAVHQSLQYTAFMHPQLCVSLASIAWLSGLISSLILCSLTVQLPLCCQQVLVSVLCEVPVLIHIDGVDITFNEVENFVAGVIFLIVPVSLILVSYDFITKLC